MARAQAPEQFAREVIERSVSQEMQDSFVPYALSVTTARAIPDVRDGLKPVQRRILFAMDDMGLRPGTPRRKSANVVGRVMADFHPHGDGAIYEAMARMAQDFAMSVPLVDPQGNFGSLDDPPAAYRYTEARLAQSAMALIGEIDEETVDFAVTYSGEGTEPVCLPALLPNLLVNGASGIAVGMATSMPPHNLAEVAAAIELVMTKRRPKPTIDELMERLPGPDFPGGGIVIDDGSLRTAYETGRGGIRVRARAAIEPVTARRQAIVVTELPYMVGPERVIAKILDLVRTERLPGISDVKNLSDRKNGLRIVVECRADADPQRVLAQLFRLTPMEETFSVNNVALVDGVPTTLGLYDLCRLYAEHRLDVVVRRTQFRLQKAEDRAHIVEGLLIALDDIDRVIAIIRGSADVAEARVELMAQLTLSEIQANHILDMQLRRLTALEITKLREELAELRERIDGYRKILASEARQRTIVLKELAECAAEFGVPRRSDILPVDEVPVFEPGPPVVDPDQARLDFSTDEFTVTLSTSGLLGRTPVDGDFSGKPGRHDVVAVGLTTTGAGQVLAITDRGRVLSVRVSEIPDIAGRSRGASVTEMFALARSERPVGMIADPAAPVLVATRSGVVKRLAPDQLTSIRSGSNVINLKSNDRVVAAFAAPDETEIVLVAGDAQALRTSAATVSVQGPSAAGVTGMRLRKGVELVAAGPVEFGTMVALVTEGGGMKVTDTAEVPTKGRATGGVRLTKLGDEPLRLAYVGPGSGLAAIVNDDAGHLDATPVALELEPTRRDGAVLGADHVIAAIGRPRHT